MIEYDPHDWLGHFFDLKGSMIREITGRLSVLVIWAFLVVVLDRRLGTTWHISPSALAVVGSVLGFLLVFRTNSSYDRWWEGRKLWGAIINETRNLARLARAHLDAEPVLRDQVIAWTSAFATASMHRLRKGTGLGAAADRLPEADVAEVLDEPHLPLAIAGRISALLADACRRGLITDRVLQMIDQNVQLLVDYFGSCERIHRTPLPFAYVVHVRRVLLLYVFVLPLAIVDEFAWMTVPATLVVGYVFYGIEEIGVEIENPFDTDDNDLPLEIFCATIERDLLGIDPTA